MQCLVLGGLPINQPQEREPFPMAMVRQAHGQDFALGNLQRGKQGRGAMPLIVMRHRSTTAFLEGVSLPLIRPYRNT